MVTVNGTSSGTHGSMLRVLGAARKREVKATQNLSIIVLFFMVCWIPLYTINFFQAYYPPWHAPSTVTFCCIILSHLNSAGNPLLYAYHLRDFRAALRSLLFGLTPEKVVGRENTAFQETPTEQRDRLKRVSSASILYPPIIAQPLQRGHRRSMTVPLYHPESVYQIPQHFRALDLNLSCIAENSQSEEPKSMSVLHLPSMDRNGADIKKSLDDALRQPKDSPMAYMDERTQEVYGLGLVAESSVSAANGRPYNLADVEDLGVGMELVDREVTQ
ncbi:G-protein coupled adenosine receptor activity protein [Homalodisca vitripennis]|nr:G-protein coupled adenosine receptor activity protein [Homalodisca vitripennis]